MTKQHLADRTILWVIAPIAAIVVGLTAGSAHAQSASYSLTNSGRIDNHVATFAQVSGDGSSVSKAQGSASAAASGYVTSNPVAGGQSLTMGGVVATQGSGMAFNVSQGAGATGSASSNGWADANVNGVNTYTDPHASITMAGSTDSGMTVPVNRGVDYTVTAGRSQDGFAQGADGGSFDVAGQTQQLPVAGGATVAAYVQDNKTSYANASTGAVTFTDGTPVGQTAAYRESNAGNNTDVSGSFIDPASK
jgi:hypothetical protein